MNKRPNILFVLPDQLSARWLGCYGSPVVRTPHLDRFAEHGIRFSSAYTNSPVCTPYRACLFTGQYPSRTGVRRIGDRLPDAPTLATRLNDVGYDTRYIGKWHLSGQPHGNHWVPPEHRGGFRHFTGWESHHVDHYKGLIWKDDPNTPIPLKGHETDGLTDIACDEIAALQGNADPFFMCVAMQAPHAPSSPPDEYYRMYGPEVMDGPPSSDAGSWFKQEHWNADYGVEEFRKRYFGEISHCDAAFGRILDALERSGHADNTIVMFTSDHGDMAGCHGLFGKGVMHDESVRVPLLVRMPGQDAPQVITRNVGTVDLFSTLLELAGTDSPGTAMGRAFTECLNGSDTGSTSDSDVFIEYREDCIIHGSLKAVAERGGDKLIRCYDLQADPYELHNIADRVDADTAGTLMKRIGEWRQKTR